MTKKIFCLQTCINSRVRCERNAVRRLRMLRYAQKALDLKGYVTQQELSQDVLEAMDRKEGNSFQVHTAADREALDVPEVQWVLPGVIPAEDLTILGGRPKVGKTVLAYSMCAAVRKGEGVWDRVAAKPRTVLIISDDQSAADTKKMATDAGLWQDKGVLWSPSFRFTEEQLDALLQTIEKHPGVFVVMDSLRSTTRSKSFGENDQDMGVLLYDLKSAITNVGGSLLIIHHCNKGNDAIGLEALSGHNAIGGAANTILTMHFTTDTDGKQLKQEPYRRLVREARSGEPFDEVLGFDLTNKGGFRKVMDHDLWKDQQQQVETNDGEDDFTSGLPEKVQKKLQLPSERHQALIQELLKAERDGDPWVKFGELVERAGISVSDNEKKAAMRFLDSLTGAVHNRNLDEKGAPKAYAVMKGMHVELNAFVSCWDNPLSN